MPGFSEFFQLSNANVSLYGRVDERPRGKSNCGKCKNHVDVFIRFLLFSFCFSISFEWKAETGRRFSSLNLSRICNTFLVTSHCLSLRLVMWRFNWNQRLLTSQLPIRIVVSRTPQEYLWRILSRVVRCSLVCRARRIVYDRACFCPWDSAKEIGRVCLEAFAGPIIFTDSDVELIYRCVLYT